MVSGDGIGSMQQVSIILHQLLLIEYFIWLATFENDRVQSRHLDPAPCRFPVQLSVQLSALVSGSEGGCKAILFHHQVLLLSHELRVLAIQRSDTFCQMLDPPAA
jgi:hypothetical protein